MDEMNTTDSHDSGHDWKQCEHCREHGWRGMHGYGHRFFLLRLLLGLIILGLVFFIGLKIGEFKGAVEGEFGWNEGGYHMRGIYPPMWMGYPYREPLPLGTPAAPQPQSSTPAK